MCPYTVLHLHCHLGFSVGVSVCVCLYGLAFVIFYGIFRRTSVCVCLYGFTFEISHRTLRRGGACSSRCTKLCHSINPCKYDYISRFASLQSLWAFNFGHPCPPSKKGEVLLLGQAEPTMVGIVIAKKF